MECTVASCIFYLTVLLLLQRSVEGGAILLCYLQLMSCIFSEITLKLLVEVVAICAAPSVDPILHYHIVLWAG